MSASLATLLLTVLVTAPPADAPDTVPPTPALSRFTASERLMGMDFTLSFYCRDEAVANRAGRAVFDRIRELNAILSDYDPDSELRRLSATAGTGKTVELSRDLWTVLEFGQQLSEKSSGAFDLTVGPLVQIWRKSRRVKSLPPDDLLATARAVTGYRKLQLDPNQRTARLDVPKMQLDCGGIAVGYALDESLRLLKEMGIDSAMIDGSGDIAVSGPPPGEPGWKIAVAPLEPDGPPSQTLILKHAAVTTSGDAWQHVEIDGVRYSHIVDTRTGLGLTTHTSVTVMAKTGIVADSYATAACVLGPEKGVALIESEPTAACLFLTVPAGSNKPQRHTSKRWPSIGESEAKPTQP
jgi:thiamine biosynthesis lipoprotein